MTEENSESAQCREENDEFAEYRETKKQMEEWDQQHGNIRSLLTVVPKGQSRDNCMRRPGNPRVDPMIYLSSEGSEIIY